MAIAVATTELTVVVKVIIAAIIEQTLFNVDLYHDSCSTQVAIVQHAVATTDCIASLVKK